MMNKCNIKLMEKGEVLYCDNDALYYYELESRVALRCAEHKGKIQSTIIHQQGDLPLNENEQNLLINKLESHAIARLKKCGITNIEEYEKKIDSFTDEITNCTPSKFKKLKKHIAKKALGDCIRNGTLPEKIKFGNTTKERLGIIEQMIANRYSGFPDKEQVESQLQSEAAIDITAKMAELEKSKETK